MQPTELYHAVKHLEKEFGSVDRAKRDTYISTALGGIIASVASLPSQPVTLPTNYWVLTHESKVREIFSNLNEMYVFNIPLALKVARQVYLARYRRVYDTKLILGELTLLLPDHVSQLPEEVKDTFANLSESQKHGISEYVIGEIQKLMG